MEKYEAEILRIIDGDTYDVLVNLGWGVLMRHRVRLRGIDTPEMNTQEGKDAKAFAEEILLDQRIYLTNVAKRTDKYGRTVAKIWLVDEGRDITEYLLTEGYGVPYREVKMGLDWFWDILDYFNAPKV